MLKKIPTTIISPTTRIGTNNIARQIAALKSATDLSHPKTQRQKAIDHGKNKTMSNPKKAKCQTADDSSISESELSTTTSLEFSTSVLPLIIVTNCSAKMCLLKPSYKTGGNTESLYQRAICVMGVSSVLS
jgi:hypothetical protein